MNNPATAQPSISPPPRPISRSILRPLLLVLMFVSGVAAAKMPQTVAALRGKGAWIDPIREVHAMLSAVHADQPDEEAMQRAAIDGMLESLNDRYAEYIPPTDKANFEKELNGTYSGIGAEIEIRDGWLTVVAPLEDSPALRAGILPNDRIIKIEDETTFRLSADECIKRLVGPEGTDVRITILRSGNEIPLTLTRKQIIARSVRGLHRIYGDDQTNGEHDVHWDFLIDPAARFGYIRLSQFTSTAGDDLLAALDSASTQAGPGGLAGLILDLRGNPGGSLEASIDVADIFLPEGDVVSVRGRAVAEQTFDAMPASPADGRYETLPIVVLVDRISASASEIVAGALQDQKRAVILGSRSFGKGLVQSVIPLQFKKEAQLKITTAKYYLPSGRLIQREDDSTVWGVDPDPGYFVPESDEQLVGRIIRRRQLDGGTSPTDPTDGTEALEPVSAVPGQSVPSAPSVALAPARWSDPTWIESDAADRALAGALRTLTSRATTGQFTPVAPETDAAAQHSAVSSEELRRLERAERLTTMELARIIKRIESLSGDSDAESAASDRPVDLWSDEIVLTDGRIEIRDKSGAIVATLRITGRDIERWLINADVEPVNADPSTSDPDATSAPEGQAP